MNLKELTAQGRRNYIETFAEMLEEAMPEIIRRCEEAASKGKTSTKVDFVDIFPGSTYNHAVDVTYRFSNDPKFLETMSSACLSLEKVGGRLSFELGPMYRVCVSWDE